jgi:hypothetical protein
MKSDDRRLLSLMACGVLVHAAADLAVHLTAGRIDVYAFQSRDALEYHRLGLNLATHGEFSNTEEPPFEPDTWRTPGYPLLLALLFSMFGESPVVVIVAQQALRVLSVCMLYVIARRRLDPNRAFLVALICLVEPYGIYYSFWLMSETWFVAVLLMLWLAWMEAISSRRWLWFGLAGVLSGLLVLVRPVGLLVPMVIAAGALGAALQARFLRDEAHGGSTAGPYWRGAVVFAVSCGIVLGGWMMRNRIVAGRFALSNQSGVVLAYFKAAEVALWRDGRSNERYIETSLDPARIDDPHPIWESIDNRLRNQLSNVSEASRSTLTWKRLAQGNRGEVDPFLVSDVLSEIGWSMLMESPLATATCCVVRGLSAMTFPLNLAVRPPPDQETKRIRWTLLGGLYLALACAAVAGLIRMSWNLSHSYFSVGVILALLAATVPQLDPRFRVPMVPLLLVLAFVPGFRSLIGEAGEVTPGPEAKQPPDRLPT